MTPHHATLFCKDLCEKAEKNLAALLEKVWLAKIIIHLGLFFLLSFECFLIYRESHSSAIPDYPSLLTQSFLALSGATVLFAWPKKFHRSIFTLICLLVLILLNSRFLFSFLIYFGFSLLLFFTIVLGRQYLKKNHSFWIILGLCALFLLIWTVSQFELSFGQNFFPFHIRGLPLLYIPLIYSVQKKEDWLKTLSFPLNWLMAVPVTSEEWRSSERSPGLLASGLFDLFLGSQALVLLLIFKDRVSFYFMTTGFFEFLIFGFKLYFYYYLFSFGFLSAFVGCGKLMGYHWKKPFFFPFLSHNPSERWRRWNFQYFQFFNSFSYLSLMRFTRSSFVSILFTFLFSAFVHIEVSSYSETTPMTLISFLIGHFFFFLMHGLAVYLSIRFKSIWGQKEKISGWWGVILTNFLMILIHGARFITL